MSAGLTGLDAHLVYDFKQRRVVWNVMNVLYDEATDASVGESGGDAMKVDAVSGKALALLQWQAIPN